MQLLQSLLGFYLFCSLIVIYRSYRVLRRQKYVYKGDYLAILIHLVLSPISISIMIYDIIFY